jgi:hypothetical protein
VLVFLLSSMVRAVGRVWVAGGERVENFQNGRAILELISRELSPAVISNSLQFVQNPGTPSAANLNALLPASSPQVANSDSLFWQAPGPGNAVGNISEIGYFLTQDLSTPSSPKYRLHRFAIQPDNLPVSDANHRFRIYDSPSAFTGYPAASRWLPPDAAPWLTQLTATQFQASLSPLSDGVIAFWVRCLDKNGDLIPWLKDAASYSSAVPLKFNSAAGFNPAVAGSADSFHYTDMASTLAANRLPSAVELTIVTIDSSTLDRPDIPAKLDSVITSMSAPADPDEVSALASQFMANLAGQGITSARLFSTTVPLANGTD